jgi:PhzF family phenazine biosynthesis protein
MKLTLYQVDAFTDKLFRGNPAAVIPLKKWIKTDLMQKLAMENNLAETVFFVPSKNKKADFDIRWFTPELEMDLCGHATLAAAFIIFNFLRSRKKKVVFDSASGLLTVVKKKKILEMDFPSWNPEQVNDFPVTLKKALGVKEIAAVYQHRDTLVELREEEDVVLASPDFNSLKKKKQNFIITAPGKKVDFVSRFFAPAAGIPEDPVTGSAHSQLIPFWNQKSGKNKMTAKQLSQRGGTLYCRQKGDRVIIGGQCVFYMKGEIKLS